MEDNCTEILPIAILFKRDIVVCPPVEVLSSACLNDHILTHHLSLIVIANNPLSCVELLPSSTWLQDAFDNETYAL